MPDELVKFDEASGIEKNGEPFSGRQLSLLVLFFDAVWPATCLGGAIQLR
jgi:hypothetical protein